MPSGLGDGLYDVFAHFVGSRVGAVFVEFIAPDDEARVIKDVDAHVAENVDYVKYAKRQFGEKVD